MRLPRICRRCASGSARNCDCGERLSPSWRAVRLGRVDRWSTDCKSNSRAGSCGWQGGWAVQGTLQVRPCKLGRRLLVCAVLRTRQDRGWASCPTRPRHASGPCGSRPCTTHPPCLRQFPVAARHGRKKEEQPWVARFACSQPSMARLYKSTAEPKKKDVAKAASFFFSISSSETQCSCPPSPGNCRRWGGGGWQDRRRHGWRLRAPKDGFTACPASRPRPAKPSATQSRVGC